MGVRERQRQSGETGSEREGEYERVKVRVS